MIRFKTYYNKLNEVSNYNGILMKVIDDFKKNVRNIYPNGTYKIDFTDKNYPGLKDITVILNNELEESYVKIGENTSHYCFLAKESHVLQLVDEFCPLQSLI